MVLMVLTGNRYGQYLLFSCYKHLSIFHCYLEGGKKSTFMHCAYGVVIRALVGESVQMVC